MCYNISNSHLIFNQVICESSLNAQVHDLLFYDYLEGCLRHKAEMVILEDARVTTELTRVTSQELTPVIIVFQLFLSSSNPVLWFAVVYTLNNVGVYCYKTI